MIECNQWPNLNGINLLSTHNIALCAINYSSSLHLASLYTSPRRRNWNWSIFLILTCCRTVYCTYCTYSSTCITFVRQIYTDLYCSTCNLYRAKIRLLFLCSSSLCLCVPLQFGLVVDRTKSRVTGGIYLLQNSRLKLRSDSMLTINNEK